MKKILSGPAVFMLVCILTMLCVASCKQSNKGEKDAYADKDRYDGPAMYAAMEYEKTKDPSLGYVPKERLLDALSATTVSRTSPNGTNFTSAFNWTERGPNSDVAGPSNGNTRANNGIPSGRIRAVMVDSLDPSHKTVFVAGVDGGVWKTTNITNNPANWILVNDFLSNLAVTSITQDPSNFNIMYFCTGEGFFNSDAVRGVGVFKSTDGGNTWNFLPSTATYFWGSKIMCDSQGNVYLATRGNGLVRSNNGGASWTDITPTGMSIRVSDIEISKNTGRLHASGGIFSAQTYRFTDNPATVTSAGWTAPTTPYPSFNARCEIAASGNTLYALPSNTSFQVDSIYKSTDGGVNWAATPGQPIANWANGQAWYSISAGISDADPNHCIVGGLDTHRTLDGGLTWVKISSWVGLAGQYVHADQHNVQWYDGGSKLIFAADGGIHYSSDGGVTIRDRNVGLRLKQFYSVAIHPTTQNYFLGGTQDNGTHQLTNPGLGSSIEVTGGDGAYTDIDQDEPQFQYGAFVFNQYRRSVNGGASWSSVNFSGTAGRFINPFDYDDVSNRFYAAHTSGQYLRWNDPQTGNSSDLVEIASFAGTVSAVTVSPFTVNRVYFGIGTGRVIRVDNAHEATPTDVNITGAGMAGYVNCVNTGSSDEFLVACYTNYGVNNVWVSANGGSSWSAVDGNLPDMPVRWAMFHPNDNTKMILATETGIWQTDLLNGANTVWASDPSFPAVRTDMIKYRSGDRTIAAGTHGRGIWTATIPPVASCNPPVITVQPTNVTACPGTTASFSVTATGDNPLTYRWQRSTDGGTTYTDIPGATSSTYSFTATNMDNGYRYRVVVTNTCAPFNATSTGALLTVSSPTISGQPANASACSGQNATFTVQAAGSGLMYQWQVSVDGGLTFTNLSNNSTYSGVTTATLSVSNVTAAMNNYRYRVVVNGSCAPSVTSTAATLTVATQVTITASPKNVTVCAGELATFVVTAQGDAPITYQWQVSTDNGTTFTNIAGATSATYSFTAAISQNGNRYRAVVNNSCGIPAISAAAILTVNSVVITANPQNVTVCVSQQATFTVSASGGGLTYQWQLSTDAGITFNNLSNNATYSGVTTATLTVAAVTTSMSNFRFRVVVTGICNPPAVSQAATLTVNSPAVITSSPVDVTVCTDGNATFTVTATGTALTYQWQVSTNNGATFTNIPGATSASYTITGATNAQNNNLYRVVVSGAAPCGSVISATAKLMVGGRPVVNLVASPFTKLLPGLVTTLTVTPNFDPANFNFVWFRNDVVLPGVTGNTYQVDITRLGSYKVLVTDKVNGCNNTSQAIAITDSASTRLFIYPSPTDGLFTVSYFNGTSNNQQNIAIYDSRGTQVVRRVVSVVAGYTLVQIDMLRNAPGVYFVDITDAQGKRLATGKVMIR